MIIVDLADVPEFLYEEMVMCSIEDLPDFLAGYNISYKEIEKRNLYIKQ